MAIEQRARGAFQLYRIAALVQRHELIEVLLRGLLLGTEWDCGNIVGVHDWAMEWGECQL